MFNSANKRRNAIEERRRLHARIARSRRRINGHTSRLAQSGFLPISWRKAIQDHPAMALATAAGAGMLLARLSTRIGAASGASDWLAQWLAGGTWASLMKHVESFMAAGEAGVSAPVEERDDV